VAFILLIMAGVTIIGINLLLAASGGEKNMANTPMAAFYLELVLDLVVSLSIGFPLAMVPAAALVDGGLPSRTRIYRAARSPRSTSAGCGFRSPEWPSCVPPPSFPVGLPSRQFQILGGFATRGSAIVARGRRADGHLLFDGQAAAKSGLIVLSGWLRRLGFQRIQYRQKFLSIRFGDEHAHGNASRMGKVSRTPSESRFPWTSAA